MHCELNNWGGGGGKFDSSIGGCKINNSCVVVFNFGVEEYSGVVTVSAASDIYFISPASYMPDNLFHSELVFLHPGEQGRT